MRLSNSIIFVFILVVAVVLRFWEYASIPFTHDEFSALFRTDFGSFSELISEGVRPDGHPAGIQVFLYYWVQWFGDSTWVVKLPFTLMGIGSLVFIYHTCRSWFTQTSALLSTAVIAVSQYHVMYSVIARPYISGLFFSSVMVYFWAKMMLNPKRNFWWNSVGFILGATLCAYNHHFSLLFAGVIGVSGLFFISSQYILRYLLLGVIIILLYLPHLEIFLYQLSHEGVGGWLAKPENDWLWTYLRYVFHFNWLFLAIVVGLVLASIFIVRSERYRWKFILLSFCWFFIPFGIGFWYSRNVSAVLQYSVLLFSFPYLIFFLFGSFKELKSGVNAVLVLVLFAIGIYSLVHGRRHYDVTYASHYEHIVEDMAEARKRKASVFILASHEKITKHYLKKHPHPEYVWADSIGSYQEFRQYIKKLAATENHIYYGAWEAADANYISIIREYFPELSWRRDYIGGSTYVFSHKAKTVKRSLTVLDFQETYSAEWEGLKSDKLVLNELSAYQMDSTSEWSPSYTTDVSLYWSTPNDFLKIAVNVKPINGLKNASIVCIIEHKGKVLHWSEKPLSLWLDTTEQRWGRAYHTISLGSFVQKEDMQLKTFIWNKNKGSFLIDDYEVTLYKGNPVLTAWRDDY